MKFDVVEILEKATQVGASDIHITVGVPITLRINGHLKYMDDYRVMPDDIEHLLATMLTEKQYEKFKSKGEMDFSFSTAGVGRYRVNAFKQRGSMGMVLRIVSLTIPSMEELRLPSVLKNLCAKKRGLILVTGPTGSGKSTTLAAMIDYINDTIDRHIITIEDPIEFLHKHKKCVINQREVGNDTESFALALRASLRQDPDIILVGEMRDLETISTAITAAETGHLVMSTLHTVGAASTVDRIIDVFPPHQQQQVKIQLSMTLEAIISQQLLPSADGRGRVACFEVLIVTPAARALIREGKTHLIQNIIQTGNNFGMISMDNSILENVNKRMITAETAKKYCVDLEYMTKQLMYL